MKIKSKRTQIKSLAVKYMSQYGWRWGQSIFNAAYNLYPNEANKLRGSDVDCYHIDSNTNLFLKTINKL